MQRRFSAKEKIPGGGHRGFGVDSIAADGKQHRGAILHTPMSDFHNFRIRGGPVSVAVADPKFDHEGPGTLDSGAGSQAMSSESEVIETTVGKAAAELAKRGLGRDDRVTIEPNELIPGRRAARA
jgi:hypothetical protein